MLSGLFRFGARRKRRAMMAAADRARDAGNRGLAIALYGLAVERFPDALAPRVQLGNALKDEGRYEEAGQSYLQALALKPDDADTYLQLGHLAKIRGRVAEAVAYYEQSDRLDPDRPDAARELAALGVKRGQAHAIEGGPLDLPDSAALVYRRLSAMLAYRRA